MQKQLFLHTSRERTEINSSVMGWGEILRLQPQPVVARSWVRPLSSILSAFYIAGIFILPRVISGPLLSKVWNPYSLLHIPMYGVLMVLLTLAFEPHIFFQRKVSSRVSFFFLPGGIATTVGILDEFHQSFIPYRNASVGDIMLDIAGIVLTGIFINFNHQRKRK